MEFDRRALLTGIAATAMTATATRSALAAPRAPFFKRIGRPIGLQLYTLGDAPAKDLAGVLTKVAAIGYREIELPGLYARPPAEIKALADKAGLKITSLHVPASAALAGGGISLESAPQLVADTLGALGIDRAVMPIVPLPPDFRPAKGETFQLSIARSLGAAGADLWKRTAALLNEKAAALKPHGISLGYHNHNVEFAPIGNTTGWAILAHETDPKLVTFEVDVGWIAAAGIDPAAFLTRHSGRVRQLHVKDVQASTKTNYALSMDPTEVGSGKLDWAKILPAAHKAGVQHFYVEQEPPFTVERMDAAAKSYGFLAGLVA